MKLEQIVKSHGKIKLYILPMEIKHLKSLAAFSNPVKRCS